MTREHSRHPRGLRVPQASAVLDVGEEKSYRTGHGDFGVYGGRQDPSMVARPGPSSQRTVSSSNQGQALGPIVDRMTASQRRSGRAASGRNRSFDGQAKNLLSPVSVTASILRCFADMRIRRRTVPLPGRIVLNRLMAYKNQFEARWSTRRCRECPAITGVAANSFGAARRRPR